MTRFEIWPEVTSPKMIIAGASAYPRIIDFKCFAEIAHEVGAYLFVDMAHIAGLVAAGLHPSPIPYADVVSTTTHKTLRGPRGGMLLCNDPEIAKKLELRHLPRLPGRPPGAHHRRQGGGAGRSTQAGVQGLSAADRQKRRRPGQSPLWRAAWTWSPAARTTT